MGAKVTADFSALQHLLDDLERSTGDVSRAMPVIGEALHFEVLEVFEREGAVAGRPKWPPLSKSTLAKRRASASPKILQDTTNLVGSITPAWGENFVEAYTGVPYAVYHVSKAPRRVIPLRDFFAIDQAAFEAEACDIVIAYLMGRV